MYSYCPYYYYYYLINGQSGAGEQTPPDRHFGRVLWADEMSKVFLTHEYTENMINNSSNLIRMSIWFIYHTYSYVTFATMHYFQFTTSWRPSCWTMEREQQKLVILRIKRPGTRWMVFGKQLRASFAQIRGIYVNNCQIITSWGLDLCRPLYDSKQQTTPKGQSQYQFIKRRVLVICRSSSLHWMIGYRCIVFSMWISQTCKDNEAST